MLKRSKLGKAIRQLRTAKGLSQAQLGKACRLFASQISAIEIGQSRQLPHAKTAVLMARKLGIDPLVLLELGRPDFAVWRKAFGLEEKR